jgi:hypothetical protein
MFDFGFWILEEKNFDSGCFWISEVGCSISDLFGGELCCFILDSELGCSEYSMQVSGRAIPPLGKEEVGVSRTFISILDVPYYIPNII